MTPRCLVSVHDVMPETLAPVAEILTLVEKAGQRATLLVVPGRDWNDDSLHALRRLHARGHPLAGHGWSHRAERIGGFGHWLHSQWLSRNAAEHLALEPDQVIERVARCHAWFLDHGFPAPALYVPPAWALGLPRARLAELPFRYVETLTGFHDRDEARFQAVPLVGFEADTRLRALLLGVQNAAQRLLARTTGTLRVAIHPRDLELRLGASLRRALAPGRLGPGASRVDAAVP